MKKPWLNSEGAPEFNLNLRAELCNRPEPSELVSRKGDRPPRGMSPIYGRVSERKVPPLGFFKGRQKLMVGRAGNKITVLPYNFSSRAGCCCGARRLLRKTKIKSSTFVNFANHPGLTIMPFEYFLTYSESYTFMDFHIIANFPSDRDYKGSLKMYNSAGELVFGPVDALGRGTSCEENDWDHTKWWLTNADTLRANILPGLSVREPQNLLMDLMKGFPWTL
ncbi:hypothetical protein [Desulfoscipio geothermicus]|uniref:Uncharacterized protein n=1 Tax=Desulfoscipio geothermicus DSM 3669 TaxID=1121426 RepID=A0A1I6EJC2_9FIRM|nr:hypothetical protein SAMN05660706_1503 [Desulfoscipio geothermicus DSM 3669]